MCIRPTFNRYSFLVMWRGCFPLTHSVLCQYSIFPLRGLIVFLDADTEQSQCVFPRFDAHSCLEGSWFPLTTLFEQVSNNNKSTYTAQIVVRRNYSKPMHTHSQTQIQTQEPAHTRVLTTQSLDNRIEGVDIFFCSCCCFCLTRPCDQVNDYTLLRFILLMPLIRWAHNHVL